MRRATPAEHSETFYVCVYVCVIGMSPGVYAHKLSSLLEPTSFGGGGTLRESVTVESTAKDV